MIYEEVFDVAEEVSLEEAQGILDKNRNKFFGMYDKIMKFVSDNYLLNQCALEAVVETSKIMRISLRGLFVIRLVP